MFLSSSRPHYMLSEGPEAGVYVRLGSTYRQADRELIAELRCSVDGVSFDELPMSHLAMDDLAMNSVKSSFEGVREVDEKTLLTLRMLIKELGACRTSDKMETSRTKVAKADVDHIPDHRQSDSVHSPPSP